MAFVVPKHPNAFDGGPMKSRQSSMLYRILEINQFPHICNVNSFSYQLQNKIEEMGISMKEEEKKAYLQLFAKVVGKQRGYS